jgi:putative glycosyltransferase (exosortase G-associated)
MSDTIIWLLVWGVWLLIPVVTDGLSLVYNLAIVLLKPRKPLAAIKPEERLKVSIVIPAYNEEDNIDRCLMSIKAQTYPHDRLEVITVDDGSSDNTLNRIFRHMSRHPVQEYFQTSSFSVYDPTFGGTMNVVRRKRDEVTLHGKAAAVNAALALVSGDLIVAIDGDVVLAPDAIEQAVQEFLANPDMVAATGHLIIDPYLVTEYDAYGNAVMDVFGMARSRRLNWSEKVLTACQFLEYMTTFHLGRYTESATNTMFTMAGAASVFRREVFQTTGEYRHRTVSEDADLTLTIHSLLGKRVGYMRGMQVHLAPTLSWAQLYSQRVRWQRGALEVIAAHRETATRFVSKAPLFWRVALPLRLQVDHTMAMPRMIWNALIFAMPLFGYSWSVVVDAFLLLAMFYVITNTLRIITAYSFSTEPEKVLARRYLGYMLLLPAYHMFLFWTRMSGVLIALTKDAQWTVKSEFLELLEDGRWLRRLRLRLASFLTFLP